MTITYFVNPLELVGLDKGFCDMFHSIDLVIEVPNNTKTCKLQSLVASGILEAL